MSEFIMVTTASAKTPLRINTAHIVFVENLQGAAKIKLSTGEIIFATHSVTLPTYSPATGNFRSA